MLNDYINTVLYLIAGFFSCFYCFRYLLIPGRELFYEVFATAWILLYLIESTLVIYLYGKVFSNFIWIEAVFTFIAYLHTLLAIWMLGGLSRKPRYLVFPLLVTQISLVYLVFIKHMRFQSTQDYTLLSLIILVFSAWHIFRILASERELQHQRDADFWICCGFIIYWGLQIPFNSIPDKRVLNQSMGLIYYYFNISTIAYCIYTLFIIKSIRCKLRIPSIS